MLLKLLVDVLEGLEQDLFDFSLIEFSCCSPLHLDHSLIFFFGEGALLSSPVHLLLELSERLNLRFTTVTIE